MSALVALVALAVVLESVVWSNSAMVHDHMAIRVVYILDRSHLHSIYYRHDSLHHCSIQDRTVCY